MRERRRRAHGHVERAAAAARDVGERVEEQDDVGVPLRVLLVHVAARRAARVARQLMRRTRSPGAHSRMSANSMPSPLRPRGLVADEDLRLERREHRAQRLDARIDAQRLRRADLRLPRVEAEPVARAHEHRPDRERAPALAAQVRSSVRGLASTTRARIARLRRAARRGSGRKTSTRSAPAGRASSTRRRGRPRPRARAPGRATSVAGDLRVARERGADDRRERERRRERDELDAAERRGRRARPNAASPA